MISWDEPIPLSTCTDGEEGERDKRERHSGSRMDGPLGPGAVWRLRIEGQQCFNPRPIPALPLHREHPQLLRLGAGSWGLGRSCSSCSTTVW